MLCGKLSLAKMRLWTSRLYEPGSVPAIVTCRPWSKIAFMLLAIEMSTPANGSKDISSTSLEVKRMVCQLSGQQVVARVSYPVG